MRNVKRFAAMILALSLFVFLLAGCSGSGASSSAGGSGSSSNGKVVVNFWHSWTGSGADAMKKLIKEFNQSQNKIIVKGLSQSDSQKQLNAIVGGHPPDLMAQGDENRLASWAARGAIEPLDKYIKQDKYNLKDFLPGALNAIQYNGKTWALPMGMNTWMLYYNKDIFKKAGISSPPKTMQQLKKDAVKLTKVKSNGRLERLGISTSANPYILMYSYGGHMWNPQTKQVTPLNPGFKSAVKFQADIWHKYGASQMDRFTSGLGKYVSPQNPFMTGKYAMHIDGEYFANIIHNNKPNLNYGIAPVPYDAGKPEAKNNGYMNVNVIFIPKGAAHPKAAWKFLKWLTAKKQMIQFDVALGNLAPRKSAVNDPAFKNVPGFNVVAPYAKSANLQPLPNLPFLSDYLTELSKQEDNIFRGKVSLDKGLKAVKTKIQPMVKKTGK